MDDLTPRSTTHAAARPQSRRALIWLLIALTGVGYMGLNIMVPALPVLAKVLAASPDTVQLSISLFLIGLAGAQLIVGPLSDRFGRRPVILCGMTILCVSSLAMLLVANVTTLVAARLVQAFGAATGIALGRAIIRDLYEREEAASVLGLVTAAMVVPPMIAPFIGGVLETMFGWQSIFAFMGVASFAALAWSFAILPETQPQNISAGETGFLANARVFLTSRVFVGYVLSASFASGTFYVFLGSAPFIVVTIMDRTSAEFGVWFILSSIGYVAGNFIASRVSTRYGLDGMILRGLLVEAAAAGLGFVWLAVTPQPGPLAIFIPQLFISLGNGLMMPSAIAGAVSVRPKAAGAASGLFGCIQMTVSAALVQIGGMVIASATSPWPLSVMLVLTVGGFALAFFGLVRPKSFARPTLTL